MNQLATVTLHAGGPGSGCNPKAGVCGRPAGKAGKEKTGLARFGPASTTKPPQQLGNRGLIQVTRKQLERMGPAPKSLLNPQRRDTYIPKKATAPVKLSPQEQERLGSRVHQPTEREKENLKKIQEQDHVVLMKSMKVENRIANWSKTVPIGRKATVLDVIQRPGVPAQVKLLVGRDLKPAYVNIEDVQLLKKGKANPRTIETEPVRRSKVVQRYTSSDGAQVTVVKPSKEKETDDMRGKMRPHSLKGKFKQDTGQVEDLTDPMIRRQSFTAVRPKERKGSDVIVDPDTGAFRKIGQAGTTVMVERNYKTGVTKIQEINTGQYGHSFSMLREHGPYKNHGVASGFLNKRFGIKQSLPKKLRREK
jgi:hypothetical protein